MVTAMVGAGLGPLQFTEAERALVYGVALKYLRDADAAHDVAQEALLLAFRNRHTYRGEARVTTWLYRIAATTALMYLRGARRRAANLPLARAEAHRLPEPCAPEPSPEELSSWGETVARCERIVAELGPRYAPLFHLRYVEDFSPVEVAQRLGLTVSTVHARSHRARTHVKRRLVEEGLAAGGGARPAMAAGGSG